MAVDIKLCKWVVSTNVSTYILYMGGATNVIFIISKKVRIMLITTDGSYDCEFRHCKRNLLISYLYYKL